MKFVPIKRVEQQDILLSHRARELAVKQKTAQANQIRGLLAEYGVVIPKGISHIDNLVQILDDNISKLTTRANEIFLRLYEQFKEYAGWVETYDKEIEQMALKNPLCKEILKIEGVGPLTASAMVATLGDAKLFKNGREVSAWLGLVPKQHSSGNSIRLGGISKRGDRYMRKLLINGGRTVVKNCENKTDGRNLWVANKKQRSGYNKAAVAVANKNARIIWAILATGECYRKPVAPNKILSC
jgi:transposase